jgi:small-conductance mechanosensitive channel
VGAAVWIGVLLALVVGFDALARWVLHATTMSAALAFTVLLGFAIAGATAATLARLGGEGPLLRRAGVLLARRMISLLRIALLVVGALVLLDIWGATGSPIANWQRIMAAGFTVGTLRVTFGRVLLGALVVYLAVLLSGLIRSLVTLGPELGRPTEGVGRLLHADRGVVESITRLAQYAFVTLGVILALAVIGVELQNFAIVAGALGIGVGFGLQNVVSNFASGLILLFERPVRVGDAVVVGDVWGTIQKIGLRSTIMLTLDQSEMVIPNGDLVSEKVINWTLSSPMARMFLPVGVAYGSPVAKVLEVLEQAAFAHHSVLKTPAPEALFMGFGDSSLDFELRLWVQDIRFRMEMRSAVLAEIDRRLREAGIEIPFPQRDLHLRSVDREALKGLIDRG